MSKYAKVLFLVGLILIFFGCNGSDSAPAHPTSSSESSQPKESLEEQVKNLKAEVSRLRGSLSSMQNGLALVDTENKVYDIAQTKYGAFAVVCKNVTPYLDGYKVNFDVGNLTSATFRGAKVGINWGTNTKSLDVNNIFYPGRYTNVEVILTPAKPEDVKTVIVSLEFNTLAMPR